MRGKRILLSTAFAALISYAQVDGASKCTPIAEGFVASVQLAEISKKIGPAKMRQLNVYLREASELLQKKKAVPSIFEVARSAKESASKVKDFLTSIELNNPRLLVLLAREKHAAEFEDEKTSLGKKIAGFIKTYGRLPNLSEQADLFGCKKSDLKLIVGEIDDLIALADASAPSQMAAVRSKLISAYAKIVRETLRVPTPLEVAHQLGYSEEKHLEIYVGEKGLFKDWNKVKERAQAKSPSSFNFYLDTDEFNAKKKEAYLQALLTKRRFIVVTAVAGHPLNEEFFEAAQKLAELKDAEILVFAANMKTFGLPKPLTSASRVHVITNTTELTPFLRLWRLGVIPKQIKPMMGLMRLGKRGQTQIIGAPKAHEFTVGTLHNDVIPHGIFTAPAITDPLYAGKRLIQHRTDEIAEHDHFMGALLLEKTEGDQRIMKSLQGTGSFHIRRLEFIPEKKGFADLDHFYTSDGVEAHGIEAMAWGDLHTAVADQAVLETLKEQIKRFRPKRIVLHDFFDGTAINHHESGKAMTLAQRAARGELDLRNELSQAAVVINAIHRIDPTIEIVIPRANHPDWLYAYLDAGQFMREPHNTAFGLELAAVYSRKQNPIEYAFKFGNQPYSSRDPYQKHLQKETLLAGGGLDFPDMVRFMGRGESYKVGPAHREVEIGLHGDKGNNGSKGGLLAFLQGAGRGVFGHTHTDAAMNGAVNIGTFTELKQPYNSEGFSSWVQSMALVGENGEIQKLRFQDGQWFNESNEPIDPKIFYPPGYPKIIPNKESATGAGQVDQYGEGD